MSTRPFIKDTKSFWREREQAREKLDAKRSSESASRKAEVAEKLRKDAIFLKSGRAA